MAHLLSEHATGNLPFNKHCMTLIQPVNGKYITLCYIKKSKGKGSQYSIAESRVLELILVLDSQPAGDVNHKPDSRLPLLSARPAVTPATLKRAATNFAVW